MKSKKSSSSNNSPQQPTQMPEPAEVGKARAYNASLLDSQFTPFSGDRFADFPYASDLETTLGTYLKREPNQLFNFSQSELAKTLNTDTYDPYKGEYYKSLRDEAMANNTDAVKQVRRGAQLGGMLYSQPRVQAEGDVASSTARGLNTTLAGLAENERARKLSAVPTAMSVGQQIDNQPVLSMSAISQFSPLLQAIGQAPLDFNYSEFLREQDYPFKKSQVANSLLQNGQASYYYPPTNYSQVASSQASPFIQGGASIFSSLLGNLFGG